MDPDFEIATRPATPEFVLTVFQDWHRQFCAYYHMEPQIDLTFDSTLSEWGCAYDLIDDVFRWKNAAREMNAEWNIDISMKEWKACLTPPRKRRLGDVCELIARHAHVPALRPLRILDRDCLPGGAFLTVKAMLKKAGADVDRIGPSTMLTQYATRFPGVFLGDVSRLAPGALPAIDADWRIPGLAHGCGGIALFFAAVPALVYFPWPIAVLTAGAGIWLFLAGCLKAAEPPKPVAFGDIETFKDLAKLLAAHSCESP